MDTGPLAQFDRKTRKGIRIPWSPAQAEEIRIQKSTLRNRLLESLKLAASMTAAA